MDLSSFHRDGAIHEAGLFADVLPLLRELPTSGAGVRLQDDRLPGLLAPATSLATGLLGAEAFPVRAVMFDKTPEANWAVAWHQDRTIAVADRVETPGFGPWSRKHGLLHVMPPVEILEGMATLRIHVDACGPENAPLLAAFGTHRIGLVPAAKAAEVAAEYERIECLAAPGDVWAYSTPILHASERAASPSRRRVLQVDYATGDLPGGLSWAGVTAVRR